MCLYYLNLMINPVLYIYNRVIMSIVCYVAVAKREDVKDSFYPLT